MLPHNAQRTAIRRTRPSAPLSTLLRQDRLHGRILDYGCGHGADVDYLVRHGFNAEGYDPCWKPLMPTGEYDTILCTYVLNVIADEKVRRDVLHYMERYLAPYGTAYVTVRRDLKATGLTRQGTWQGWIVLTEPAELVARTNDYVTYALGRRALWQTTPHAVPMVRV